LLGVFAITAAAIGVGLLMQPSSESATAVSFSTPTTADTTTAATTTSAIEDVSGPCDEAEHANDPRCTGAARVVAGTAPGATAPTTTTRDDDGNREDVRGPCDEAEHANDPRCTGAA